MRNIAALLLLAALAGCASPGADVPKVDTGEIEGSATAPRNRAKIHTDLAAAYFRRGSMKVALDELRDATTADPDYAPAHNLLGMVYAELGEKTRAEESFQRSLDLAPDNPDTNHSYGVFLCENGRVDESINYFLKAARNPLFTTAWRSYSAAGVCSLRAKDKKDAEKYFLLALRLNPDEPVALVQLAKLRYEGRKYIEARRLIRRRNRVLDPSAESLWVALRIERRLGSRRAEANLARELGERFPDSAEYRALRRGEYD